MKLLISRALEEVNVVQIYMWRFVVVVVLVFFLEVLIKCKKSKSLSPHDI